MKWTQKIFFHCLLQSDFICNLIIEKFIYISAFYIIITLIWCSSHSQPKLRSEMLHYFLVCISWNMVSLIQNNTIKCVLIILKQVFISIKCLYCRKHIICTIFMISCTYKSHGYRICKYFFI